MTISALWLWPAALSGGVVAALLLAALDGNDITNNGGSNHAHTDHEQDFHEARMAAYAADPTHAAPAGTPRSQPGRAPHHHWLTQETRMSIRYLLALTALSAILGGVMGWSVRVLTGL